MTTRTILRRLDWMMVAAVGALLVAGYATVSTVTRNDIASSPDYFANRHLIYLSVGIALAVLAIGVDVSLARRVVWWAYGVTAALLVVVLALGAASAARGSQRWIALPGFNLQPSELAKPVVVLTLAAYLVDKQLDSRLGNRIFLRALGLVSPIGLLVFLEPDLGTSLVFVAVTLTTMLIAGATGRQLVLLMGAAVGAVALVLVVLPSAGVRLLQDYQQARLTAFLHPESASAAAYQQQQSMIAHGSGGVRGRGVNGALVTNLDFLPEHHTDFVFAALGEQRGFIGTALVVLLFAAVIWRGTRAIVIAATRFETLVAAGLVGMLFCQITINVGMTVGIMPITGIPLPFMTYGGSNTLVNLGVVGLLLSISLRGGLAQERARHEAGVVERERRRTIRRLRRERELTETTG